MRRSLLALFAGTAIALAATPALGDTPDVEAMRSRSADLEAELLQISAETEELGGGKTIERSESNLRGQRIDLDRQAERLDELIEKAGGTKAELEAEKKALEEQWVFEKSDAATESAEKVGEIALTQVLTKTGSKVLGAGGLVVDFVDYGGRKYLKSVDIDNLEEAIEAQRLTLTDAYKLRITASAAINENIRRQARLRELKARRYEIMSELAPLNQRIRLATEPARGGARLNRTGDAAGDARERALDARDPPRRRLKVTGSISYQWTFPETSGFGFGTRITPDAEIKIVDAEIDDMEGIDLFLSALVDEDAARVWFELATGSGDGSDSFFADAGGPDDFGFTFLDELVLGGGGTSTGLFVGNSWDVEAEAEQEVDFWRAELGYAPAGLRTDFGPVEVQGGFGLSYESWEQSGQADGVFSNGGFSITNTVRQQIDSEIFAVVGTAWMDRIISERAAFDLGVKSGLGWRETSGSVEQLTECAFCAPDLRSVAQQVRIDDEEAIFLFEAEGSFTLDITDALGLRLAVGARYGGGPAQVEIPDSPAQQPARITAGDDWTTWVNVGGRFRF